MKYYIHRAVYLRETEFTRYHIHWIFIAYLSTRYYIRKILYSPRTVRITRCTHEMLYSRNTIFIAYCIREKFDFPKIVCTEYPYLLTRYYCIRKVFTNTILINIQHTLSYTLYLQDAVLTGCCIYENETASSINDSNPISFQKKN